MNRVELYSYAKCKIEKLAKAQDINIDKYYAPNCDNKYLQLCGDIQDGGFISGIINFFGNYNGEETVKDRIEQIIPNFDYRTVLEYDNWETLLEKFCKVMPAKLDSQKQLLINQKNPTIWQKYVKGIFQGAEYLGLKYTNIKSIDDILSDTPYDFESIKSKLYELRLLKNKICGFGFALCYNWVKECGAQWLAKPDRHISKIVNTIIEKDHGSWKSFIKENPRYNNYENGEKLVREEQIALFMWEWANDPKMKEVDADITPYKLDRILYLYCTNGNFYLESEKKISEDFLLKMINND